MREAVVIDALRTPSGRGKPGGQLSAIHPVRLLSIALSEVVERNGIDPELIDDVIVGCASQAGEQASNIGRNAVLGAGFPERVPATTVDRRCGSGQQAIHFAAQGVMAGAYDIVIACGVESMSRVPIPYPRQGRDHRGPDVRQRYPQGLVDQGVSAELIASKYGLDRDQLDEFAARSHRLAGRGELEGSFVKELIHVATTTVDGEPVNASRDETIRPDTNALALGRLPAAFHSDEMALRFPEINWHITPGNSSPLTDGAAAALIMTPERANQLGLTPRARFHAFSVVGDDPLLMLTGPIPATQMVLEKSGLTVGDIDAFEVNEAFAPIPLAWQKELDVETDRINVRGGAIALGHPLGASGVRILATLLNILEDHEWRYGLQTMCEGGGLANAMIIEAA